MEELTPRQIVEELDKYIVGQAAAKRAVAIALRNRYRRRLLPAEMREDVVPKNILMIGPTGVGKTEIARRLANLAHAPFLKVEATKFTEVGYVGRDVDSMIRDLVQASFRMVEHEKMADVREAARQRAIDRVVDILHPKPRVVERAAAQVNQQVESFADAINQLFKSGPPSSTTRSLPHVASAPAASEGASDTPATEPGPDDKRRETEHWEQTRSHLREQVASGALDAQVIQVDVEDSSVPSILQVFGSSPGMPDDFGSDMQGMLSSIMPKKRKKRSLTIAEAREMLTQEEARSMIDMDQVGRDAIERAEQTGIIFVDEMDKIAGRSDAMHGPDVSREGVQRDILPIIEGSTVQTKYGSVRTDYMLFIAAGAFHVSKPSDLIPELQGRLPIRVELDNLSQDDFKRILTEPRNALLKQHSALLATEGIDVEFTEDGVSEMARIAAEANAQMENIGARRLHTILERVLDDVSFEAPAAADTRVLVDGAYVRERLESIVKNEDLSRYIL